MEDEQTPALPSETKDPDVKSVNIFEDYRKAKRNTLLWSSLTILASFGTIWPIWTGSDKVSEDITLSWVAGGIAFPPLAIIAVFTLNAIYMRLNFNWADSRMMLSNSPLLFEQSGNELARVLSSVTKEAEEARTGIEKAYLEYQEGPSREEALRSAIAEQRTDFVQRIEDASDLINHLNTTVQNGDRDPGIAAGLMDASSQMRDLIDLTTHYLTTKAAEIVAEDQKSLVEGKIALDQHAGDLGSEVALLRKTIGGITGLHESIATSERLRVYMLDYVPTFIAFWGSMLAAAVATFFQIYVVPVAG